MRKINFILFAILILRNQHAIAQKIDSINISTQKKCTTYKKLNPYIIPATLFTYGFIAPSIKGLTNTDLSIKQSIVNSNQHNSVKIDNYLQYAPAVSVYALNLLGNKGKHHLKDATKILLLSHIITTITAKGLKYTTNRLRPDSTNNHSFPSGHTATAFANATFLMMEYKHKSIWYGVAGYAVAATTGYLRMYNNKHWLSDVLAGAAVGIASTKIAYAIYPKLNSKIFKQKKNSTVVLPSYQNGAFAMNMVYSF